MPIVISNTENKNGNHRSENALLLSDTIRRDLRSEVVREIVSNKPGFLIRWGNLFFLVILAMIIIACWFIRYPDIIRANAKLTSINAPKPVVCLQHGKLIKLSVRENQDVLPGQVIGFIESTADHNEVIKLGQVLDAFRQHSDSVFLNKLVNNFENNFSKLGELQPFYQSFIQALLSYQNFLPGAFYDKKQLLLKREVNNLNKLHLILVEQKTLQERDLKIAQKTFDANESLNKGRVISDFDYRLEQSKLIGKQQFLPQINSAIINNEGQMTAKEKEILDLNATINQQLSIFKQALSTFRSQVDDWKRKYILSAPIQGKVEFSSFIQVNQDLQANQIICFINPETSQYFAEIEIPQINFGKAAIGQPVLLKFPSYPFQEYGFVKGTIEFISHIPTEKGYMAKIELTNGLITTNNKHVQYREGLLANAEIITRDMRLLERFYYDILKQLKRE